MTKFNSITKFSILIVGSLLLLLLLTSAIIKFSNTSNVDGRLDNPNLKNSVSEAIQVNVLNACGESGIADKTRKYLRMRGFDIVEIGNYREELEKSIVIDRLGDIRSAQKVAFCVGVNDSLITSEIDSSLYLRSTLVIGKDFFHLKPFK